MSKFRDEAVEHLVKYALTNEELMSLIGGKWHNFSYDHILIENRYNVLPLYRDSILQYIEENKIKPHPCAHHLDSSQIMCFNFFHPLMKEELLHLILKQIDATIDWGIPLIGKPEYISVCEKEQEERVKNNPRWDRKWKGESNIDYYIKTSNGYEVYFEIKYTESDFAAQKRSNITYQTKFDLVYGPLLESSILPNKHNRDYFLEHYQLMRNLIQLQSEKQYVVFLVPQKNKKVWEQAEDIKERVGMKYDNHCRVLDWKELVTKISASPEIANDPQLADYYAEFEKKYLKF